MWASATGKILPKSWLWCWSISVIFHDRRLSDKLVENLDQLVEKNLAHATWNQIPIKLIVSNSLTYMLIYFFLPKSLNLFSTIYFHILNSRLIIKLKFLVLLFIKKQKNIPCFARIRIRNYIFIKKRKENYS